MAKTEAAVIDFGSGKITALIGTRGVNNTFNVRGIGECEYEGFADGEWLVKEEVRAAMVKAISQAETMARTKIRHIFVGVPGAFTSVVTREGTVNFKQRKKISDEDIEALFDAADNFSGNSRYTVINRAPIYFTLDDNRRRIDPTGLATTKLSGQLSYVLVENSFQKFIGDILSDMSISKDFISASLAEALYLLEPEVRDRYAVLVDCGFITTNVMLLRGDGLLFLKSFSLGGGNITADLSEVLEISYKDAEQLKLKIKLSQEVGAEDNYFTGAKGEEKSLAAMLVHDVVTARIEEFGELIAKCLEDCEYEYPEYIPVYLTGGGLSYIRGAKEILSGKLNRQIEIVSPPNVISAKPTQSTAFGVLEIALTKVRPTPTSLWDKIFKKD